MYANERRQAEARLEREELLEKIEENRRLEREQLERIQEQNKEHQDHLMGQMAYNARLARAEEDEQARMWQSEKEAEAEYLRKVEELRNKPVLDKLHPVRRRHYKQQQKQMGTGELLGF